MKNFDGYIMTGVTEADNKLILKALRNNIELRIDSHGRVWNSGDIYIADAKEVGEGCGILC